MDREKWNEEKIEKIFSQIPGIEDNRSMEEVFTRLKKDSRLHSNQPNRKRRRKWMPAAVAMAAVIFISILLPSMLKDSKHTTVNDSESTLIRTAESEDAMMETENSIEEAAALFHDDAGPSKGHLLLNEVEGKIPFKIGLVSNAHVVPVTLLIREELVRADFPGEQPNAVQLYQKYASQIPEEALGFENYHPLEGELAVEEGVIFHMIPAAHRYDISSASIQVYTRVMQATFNDFSEFLSVQENGNPIEFSQVGTMKPVKLNNNSRVLSYYEYKLPSGQQFIVPQDAGEDAETVEEALLNMKTSPADNFVSVVPEHVHYNVRVEEGIVFIEFKEPLDLSTMDHETALSMIEGFMLTAKQVKSAVKLENVTQKELGMYDLTSKLPIPLASNPVDLILE